jgi:hypothetical protein
MHIQGPTCVSFSWINVQGALLVRHFVVYSDNVISICLNKVGRKQRVNDRLGPKLVGDFVPLCSAHTCLNYMVPKRQRVTRPMSLKRQCCLWCVVAHISYKWYPHAFQRVCSRTSNGLPNFNKGWCHASQVNTHANRVATPCIPRVCYRTSMSNACVCWLKEPFPQKVSVAKWQRTRGSRFCSVVRLTTKK